MRLRESTSISVSLVRGRKEAFYFIVFNSVHLLQRSLSGKIVQFYYSFFKVLIPKMQVNIFAVFYKIDDYLY